MMTNPIESKEHWELQRLALGKWDAIAVGKTRDEVVSAKDSIIPQPTDYRIVRIVKQTFTE